MKISIHLATCSNLLLQVWWGSLWLLSLLHDCAKSSLLRYLQSTPTQSHLLVGQIVLLVIFEYQSSSGKGQFDCHLLTRFWYHSEHYLLPTLDYPCFLEIWAFFLGYRWRVSDGLGAHHERALSFRLEYRCTRYWLWRVEHSIPRSNS